MIIIYKKASDEIQYVNVSTFDACFFEHLRNHLLYVMDNNCWDNINIMFVTNYDNINLLHNKVFTYNDVNSIIAFNIKILTTIYSFEPLQDIIQ